MNLLKSAWNSADFIQKTKIKILKYIYIYMYETNNFYQIFLVDRHVLKPSNVSSLIIRCRNR